jgi:hypothetical protein
MTFNDTFKNFNEEINLLTDKLEADLNIELRKVVSEKLEAQHDNNNFTDRVHESFSMSINNYLEELVKIDLFNNHINNLKEVLTDEIKEYEAIIESEYNETVDKKLQMHKISNQPLTSTEDRVANILAEKLKDALY